MVEAATAEREKLIRESEGQAARFNAFYETYVADKDITIRRLYLETMQEVLGRSEIIMMDDEGGSGVVPYLPLPEVQKRSRSSQPQAVGGAQ